MTCNTSILTYTNIPTEPYTCSPKKPNNKPCSEDCSVAGCEESMRICEDEKTTLDADRLDRHAGTHAVSRKRRSENTNERINSNRQTVSIRTPEPAGLKCGMHGKSYLLHASPSKPNETRQTKTPRKPTVAAHRTSRAWSATHLRHKRAQS